jgi:hypothetical protein
MAGCACVQIPPFSWSPETSSDGYYTGSDSGSPCKPLGDLCDLTALCDDPMPDLDDAFLDMFNHPEHPLYETDISSCEFEAQQTHEKDEYACEEVMDSPARALSFVIRCVLQFPLGHHIYGGVERMKLTEESGVYVCTVERTIMVNTCDHALTAIGEQQRINGLRNVDVWEANLLKGEYHNQTLMGIYRKLFRVFDFEGRTLCAFQSFPETHHPASHVFAYSVL